MGNTYIEYAPGQKHKICKKDCPESDSPNAFDDCGLKIEPDEVVIDIDHLGSKETIKTMITTMNIHTQEVWTERGVHLHFKNTPQAKALNGICALGFEIETKNAKNTPDGITVKLNGKLRETKNDGIRQDLPWFFYKKKKFKDLSGFGDGEGRNNALFYHKCLLEGHSDTVKILKFINENIFDTPLDEKEFQSVAREQDINNGKQTEYDLATQMINQYYIKIYRDSIWWFNGEKFLTDAEDNNRLIKMIHNTSPGHRTNYVNEVINQILQRAEKVNPNREFPIKLNNGVLRNGEFAETKNFTEFTPFYIDIDYDENAEVVPEVDDYLKQIVAGKNEWTQEHEDYKALLLEALAYPLILKQEIIRCISKFFVFRGDGANGKGTFLEIMRKIYNPENCTSLSITQLADPRYAVTMIGKLVNLGDDVEPDAIKSEAMRTLKNVTSCDTFETRHLYKQSESTQLGIKLFFTTNADIKTMEKGYAFKRRLMWLPMFNKVENPDGNFLSRMTSEKALKYWMKLIVESYGRLYQNKHFTKSKIVEESNEKYHAMNNPYIEFLNTIPPNEFETTIVKKSNTEILQKYQDFSCDPKATLNLKMFNEALAPFGLISKTINIDGHSVKGVNYITENDRAKSNK